MGDHDVRHRPEDGRRDRRRDRRRPVGGARDRDRDRRRQHLPRHGGRRRRGWTARPPTTPGMLATVLNALALQDALERRGRRHARPLGARGLGGRRAVHPPPRDAAPREGPGRHLRRRHRQPVLHDRHGRRAARARDRRRGDPDGEERRSRASTTATRRHDPNATFLPALTHLEAIERGLRVMDTTALSLCMENALPIHVFELADGQHPPRRRPASR